MNTKIGRNDPCPCGSGKKYKSCCMLKEKKHPVGRQKITAKWINQPHVPNLIERTFGNVIETTGKTYQAPSDSSKPEE